MSARTTSAPTSCGRCSIARPSLDPETIDDVIFGNANGAGEENRNVGADGGAARRPADERPGQHGQPALRLEPRGRHAGEPRDRDRRRLADPRRRGRVDEPRALGGAQARARLRPRPRARCTRRRSAGGWSTRRCPSSGRSRSARAPSCSPSATKIGARGAGRVRAAQPPARRPRPGRTASTPSWVIPVPDTELERDEGIRAGHEHGEARQAQARVRGGRHGHGRQRLAAQRRRRGGADRRRGDGLGARARAARADRRAAASHAVDPDIFGIAPGRGRQQGARAGRHRLGRRRRRSSSTRPSPSQSPRLTSRAGTGSTPRTVNPNGGAIAIGHPLGASGVRVLGDARP